MEFAWKSWLEKLKSTDADVRNAAARESGPMGAAAVVSVADVMASEDKGLARAATQALQHLAHYAARPGATALESQRMSEALLNVATTPRPRMVRSEAINLLGFIGGGKTVPGLSHLLADPDVYEDARMALERIPGPQAQQVLEQALKRAPANLQAGFRQSLHNRSLTMSNVGTQMMRSYPKNIFADP